MIPISSPPQAQKALLLDASARDLTTARRVVLLEILFHERYLARDQLIVRVDTVLGRYSFGKSSWEDTFYRDMRAVKRAFRAAGYNLAYQRNKPRRGYYLVDEPPVSRQITEELAGAAAEIDLMQLGIFRELSPAKRAALGASISDAAREAVAYQIAQRNPGISPLEANRLALQRAYG
jgi:hypothetical protein